MLGFRAVVLGAAIALLVGTAGFAGQEAQGTFYTGSDGALCVPMGSFSIDPPASIEKQRASVDFPHSRHFVYNCKRCHHKWDGVAAVKTCRTSGCHDQIETPKKPLKDGDYTDAAMGYYKYAYHNQCRGCHNELRIQKAEMSRGLNEAKNIPEAGPTGCIECHPK
jgi:hypothetical protein